MGKQWFPAAGIFLAAFLVVPASALSRPSAHEVPGRSPSNLCTPVMQGSRRQSLPARRVLTKTTGEVFSLLDWESEAPGMGAETLSPEAVGGQGPLDVLSLDPPPLQPAPLGTTGPAPSALTRSQPAEETLAPGSQEIAATSPSQASPACGSGKKCSKSPGAFVTAFTPASATPRTSVTPRQTQQSARAALAPTTPAPTLGLPQLLAWLSARRAFSAGTQRPSTPGAGLLGSEASPPLTLAPRGLGKVGSSVSPGQPEFASMANMLAATEPLPPAAPGWSGLDAASPAPTAGSGPPRPAVASGLGPGPSGAVLLLPSTVPSSRPSSLSSSPQPSPVWPLSSSPSPTSLSLSLSLPPSTSPSLILAPISSVTTRARNPPARSMLAFTPLTTDLVLSASGLAPALTPVMVPKPATRQGRVQPGPGIPASPTPMATLSLQRSPSLPSVLSGSGFRRVPGGADPTLSSALPHPGQAVSSQDSVSPEPNQVTRSMTLTFRITSKTFSSALWNPMSLEHQLLSERIRHQLQPIYHEAFPSFEAVGVLVFTPGSAAVNASLVFGGRAPVPSARDVLWTLYRKVKAWRGLMGDLLLVENSLTAGGSNLTDLALETISINFTAMRPFLSQFLLPGSAPFILLEKQIVQLVTPLVSRFYKAQPQQGPLLLFSNADQWVNVYMEYKFQNPIPTHLRGLASHLAHSITDPLLQKFSLVANGEKAELALYEMRLQILGRPFTLALADKTSTESQELQRQLTRWLTMVLRPLQNFSQVVVEEFQPEPLTAKVGAIFFGATPAQDLIQDCMRQALYILREAEDIWVEMVVPATGAPSSGASAQPGTGTPSSVLLVFSLLLVILVLTLDIRRLDCQG